jgi:hypothetical protein
LLFFVSTIRKSADVGYLVQCFTEVETMRMYVRPFNADPPILHAAIRNGFALDGIVVDAHITKLTRASMNALRKAIPSSAKVFVDPVTHKLRKTFFRAKATSYGRLPCYLINEFGQRAPTLREITTHVAKIAEGVIAVQDDFEVTDYTTPYLYVEADSFPSGAASTFSVKVAPEEQHSHGPEQRVGAVPRPAHGGPTTLGLATAVLSKRRGLSPLRTIHRPSFFLACLSSAYGCWGKPSADRPSPSAGLGSYRRPGRRAGSP